MLPKGGRIWEYIFSRFIDPPLLEKLVGMVYDLPPKPPSHPPHPTPLFLPFFKHPFWPFQLPQITEL